MRYQTPQLSTLQSLSVSKVKNFRKTRKGATEKPVLTSVEIPFISIVTPTKVNT